MQDEKLENIRNLLLDSENNLWTGSRFSGVSKIELDENWQVHSVKLYGKEDGLPSSTQVELNEIGADLVVSTPKGIVKYDKKNDRFEPYFGLGEKYAKDLAYCTRQLLPTEIYGFMLTEKSKTKNGWRFCFRNKMERPPLTRLLLENWRIRKFIASTPKAKESLGLPVRKVFSSTTPEII